MLYEVITWSLQYDGINPTVNQTLLTAQGSVTSFGVDENNELYIVTFSPDSRITSYNVCYTKLLRFYFSDFRAYFRQCKRLRQE